MKATTSTSILLLCGIFNLFGAEWANWTYVTRNGTHVVKRATTNGIPISTKVMQRRDSTNLTVRVTTFDPPGIKHWVRYGELGNPIIRTSGHDSFSHTFWGYHLDYDDSGDLIASNSFGESQWFAEVWPGINQGVLDLRRSYGRDYTLTASDGIARWETQAPPACHNGTDTEIIRSSHTRAHELNGPEICIMTTNLARNSEAIISFPRPVNEYLNGAGFYSCTSCNGTCPEEASWPKITKMSNGSFTHSIAAPVSPLTALAAASPGGLTTLQGIGITGYAQIVYRSTDFKVWREIGRAIVDEEGLWIFTDNDPPTDSAFYKVEESHD